MSTGKVHATDRSLHPLGTPLPDIALVPDCQPVLYLVLPILDISQQWNPTAPGLLCRASFLQSGLCAAHWCVTRASVPTFLWLDHIPLQVQTEHSLFVTRRLVDNEPEFTVGGSGGELRKAGVQVFHPQLRLPSPLLAPHQHHPTKGTRICEKVRG